MVGGVGEALTPEESEDAMAGHRQHTQTVSSVRQTRVRAQARTAFRFSQDHQAQASPAFRDRQGTHTGEREHTPAHSLKRGC